MQELGQSQNITLKNEVRCEAKALIRELGRLTALLGLSCALLGAGGQKFRISVQKYREEMGWLIKEERNLPPEAKFDLPNDYVDIQETFAENSPRLPKAIQVLKNYRRAIFLEAGMFVAAGLILLSVPVKRAMNLLFLTLDLFSYQVGSSFKRAALKFVPEKVRRRLNNLLNNLRLKR
jgi:hypothetical protein